MSERRVRWAVRLGVLLVRALGRTWRVRYVNEEAARPFFVGGAPCVFALWHGELLANLWAHRDRGAAVLISEHRDGEIIARIAEALGFRTVRGSTSRGAARALIGMTRVLEAGGRVAITPDGPRGPNRRFAPGALVAAHRAGVPVVAVGAAASRAWRLGSWDRFMIPKPFARVTIVYAEPTAVDGDSVRDAAGQADAFQALLDDATARAAGTAAA